MSATSTHPAMGPLIVVAGPSGVGKTTLVNEVLRRGNIPLRRAITATSRAPRPGEIPGTDYHYLTVDEFQAAIQQGRLLEHAVVHGSDFYGTPLAEVVPHRQAGVGAVLIIDVQGAATVRELHPGDHVSVFVLPPTNEVLEARLRSRSSEDEATVQRRLATARAELAEAHAFDHRIVNDDLTTAAEALEAVIRDYTRTGSGHHAR